MSDSSIIPPLDLPAQYQSIRAEIDAAIARVLAGGIFILGEEVEHFEQEFAGYCGVQHAAAVASGTDALRLALLACGVGPGDEVITVSHTSVATVAAIEQTGARPILVDVDPLRFTLDPDRLTSVLSPRTRAIIPVHLYGCPANLAPILEIAGRRHIFVVEDCSQAHGALFHAQKVGSWGHISAFSFYPTKNLGAYGDAGAVVTNDPALARQVRLLRQYGWEKRNLSILKGFNTRMDDLQAAVLRVKLNYLDAWNTRRRRLADLYTSLLAANGLILPSQPEGVTHIYHQYVVRHPRRDQLRQHLEQNGIQTSIHYPLPVHLQPAYANLGYQPGDLPQTELAAQHILSLPLYPELSEEAVRRVSRQINLF
jgi:dTDP-4-amino-4,6-dideoxygalactose transaminase